MPARVDVLCDAVKAVIDAFVTATPPPDGAVATVEVADVPSVDFEAMAPDTLYLAVTQDGYDPGSPVSRGGDTAGYPVRVICVARYTDRGRPTLAWRRPLSEWFAGLVDRLNDPRQRVDGAYPDASEDVQFDRAELVERKLFWSEFAVTYRDD
jgi:hypothetical protein